MSEAGIRGEIELRIPANVRFLCIVRRLVESVCLVAGFDQKTTDQVVLANEEAVTNIIEHAYGGAGDGRVVLTCRPQPAGLELTLEDHGRPFAGDQFEAPDPSEMRPGGRGVYLIRQVMDEVEYTPGESTGTVLRLFKRLPLCSCQE